MVWFSAYKKYALLWHPDKNLDRVEKANEMFRRVYEAYEFLKDTGARKEYEEEVMAKRRRVEYDYQQKQTNSKRRQELIDRLKKKEAAVPEVPTPKTSSGSSWRDNRNQSADSWWNESGSSKSQRRASGGGSARWDPGDDEELERLKQEGAEMRRRDHEEMERRMREESIRLKQEAEMKIRRSQQKHPARDDEEERVILGTLEGDEEEEVDGRWGSHISLDSSFDSSTGSVQSHISSIGSRSDLSLDDFLKFEQEVLNLNNSVPKSVNEECEEDDSTTSGEKTSSCEDGEDDSSD